MSLESAAARTDWDGTVPNAFDLRVVALVFVASGFAASANLTAGGLEFALVAFGTLVVAGLAAHWLGQRRVRRVTESLVEQWVAAGGSVESVTRSASWLRTEWIVRTNEGPVTVGGLALVPISRVSITWRGLGESHAVSAASADLESLAAEWYAEIFEPGRKRVRETPSRAS
ncbi:hypothetical protein [Natronosalvus rutilus]|uniref:DUF2244 domain-containing protein n=1 Tax=Natronosalvus rutilus TaxID=2953753 RepID=A0A9E7NDY9_9EURY|nr:hypothetical protein [Natronosalvus rutilus]UTF55204.1 hypothetical protein NGM29_08135 [Natronosalvus rutilus]